MLALASQVVADEVARTVEELDERTRQRALQADACHDEGAPEAVPADAAGVVALSAMGTIGSFEVVCAVKAMLYALGLYDALAREGALAYLLDECHVDIS